MPAMLTSWTPDRVGLVVLPAIVLEIRVVGSRVPRCLIVLYFSFSHTME